MRTHDGLGLSLASVCYKSLLFEKFGFSILDDNVYLLHDQHNDSDLGFLLSKGCFAQDVVQFGFGSILKLISKKGLVDLLKNELLRGAVSLQLAYGGSAIVPFIVVAKINEDEVFGSNLRDLSQTLGPQGSQGRYHARGWDCTDTGSKRSTLTRGKILEGTIVGNWLSRCFLVSVQVVGMS